MSRGSPSSSTDLLLKSRKDGTEKSQASNFLRAHDLGEDRRATLNVSF